LKIKILQLV